MEGLGVALSVAERNFNGDYTIGSAEGGSIIPYTANCVSVDFSSFHGNIVHLIWSRLMQLVLQVFLLYFLFHLRSSILKWKIELNRVTMEYRIRRVASLFLYCSFSFCRVVSSDENQGTTVFWYLKEIEQLTS